MTPEASARIRALEQQTKKGLEPGMMKVFRSTLFSKLHIDTKRYCEKEGGRASFEQLFGNVKMLGALGKSMASSKMDVISFAEVDSHAEFVDWQDAGCTEDWGY